MSRVKNPLTDSSVTRALSYNIFADAYVLTFCPAKQKSIQLVNSVFLKNPSTFNAHVYYTLYARREATCAYNIYIFGFDRGD